MSDPSVCQLCSVDDGGHVDGCRNDPNGPHAEIAKLTALLKRASSCIWHHHEATYRPVLGEICPVCCPDGNPYKGILAEISEALRDDN